MRRAVVMTVLLLLLGGSGESGAARHPAVVVLRAQIQAQGAQVTLGELSRDALPAAWSNLVVAAAPEPGGERALSAATLRRALAGAAPGPLPVLRGADRIRILRPGRALGTHEVERALRGRLREHPLPEGAGAQRWTLRSVPDLGVAPGDWSLRLLSAPPRIGGGNVRVEIRDGAGQRRQLFVPVVRALRGQFLRTGKAVETQSDLTEAAVVTDSLWVDHPRLWDELLRPEELSRGWITQRALPSHEPLRRDQLRARPVVWRGTRVEWIVRRGHLQVTLRAKARGEGAVGDWIYVESPLDRRLRRVRIVGPGRVADAESWTALRAGESEARDERIGDAR